MKKLIPYLQIARIDHWFKNVFLLPGVFLAIYLDHSVWQNDVFFSVILALFITGIIASSYYVLNEVLDAPMDKFHPVKKFRPVPSGKVNIKLGYALWIALGVIGIAMSFLLGVQFAIIAIWLWLMGCFYNIPPIRTKDKAYLDVISESVNNPLRLLLGWYATGTELVPPISIILAYWMLGAFFMAAKRYGEYVKIDNKEIAVAYRKSFEHYNEKRLLISMAYYNAAFGLFFGIFLIRYHIEIILLTPFIAGFMAWYLTLTFKDDSPVQYPERLYKEKGFMAYIFLCVVLGVALLFVDMPFISELFHKTEGID